ncbi:hypothetical protein ACQP2U_41530 [Nocardia sp. CA-084685]|uniref:hypothetical protein n=1 Tax=Nocardia sp. CA-084685 TaxID=3239970 RepID=UPI003D97F054
MTLYDHTGRTYTRTRQPDPRFAAVVDDAVRGMESIADVGAGSGSYEPTGTVIARSSRAR